ncbi:MAG TPA: ABC transporter permease [Candidatus Polarisedimenticolia bacterium]|nr:ABC transporter permease [Candidatus Polarisedimenticolia bacterium]
MPDWRDEIRRRLPPETRGVGRREGVVEELAQHLEDVHAALLAEGVSPEEAERRTRAELHGSGAEDRLTAPGGAPPAPPLEALAKGSLLGDLRQDLAHGLRLLRAQFGFAAIAILTLGLGTGAVAAIFSIVNAVLLRPLPFRDPERLVAVSLRRADDVRHPFNLPDFLDDRDQNRTLEGIAAYGNWSGNMTGVGEPERLSGLRVSADLFELLGVRALAGRTLLAGDDRPENRRVVVLGHSLWRRRFGGDPGVVGRTIVLNGDGYEVVGVLPAFFPFPIPEAELAIPLAPDADPQRSVRSSVNFLRAVARLGPGVTREQAESDLNTLAQQQRREHPVENAQKMGRTLTPLHEELVGGFGPALWILFGAVGLVLLIASVNLAGLALARAAARRKEMAIRAALGATRRRLARQIAAECLLLALFGAAAGIVVAVFGVDLLLAMSPAGLPRAAEVHVDLRVLAFTLGVALLSWLVFGLAPAIQGSQADLRRDLTLRRGDAGGARRGRNLLVVAEIALSLVLLAGAGLLMKSFLRLLSVDPGFETGHLLVARLSLPGDRYAGREKTAAFCEALRLRLTGLPGVEEVGVVSALPLAANRASVPFTIEGRPAQPGEEPWTNYRLADDGYFRAFGIPIVAGRPFGDRDRPDGPPVAIVSRTFASRFLAGADPIGTHLRIEDNDRGPRPVEIVGVAGDVRHAGLESDPEPHLYLPLQQAHEDSVGLLTGNQYWLVRARMEPLALSSAVRGALRDVDPDVPATSLRSMEDYLQASVSFRKFSLRLVAAFAVTALLLAATGLYGVVAYGVSRRTHEIGIRMTLGALRRDILRMVVGEGMRLAMLGTALGLAAGLALTRSMKSLLFGVGAADPWTFAGITVLLLAAALLACWLPARRATRVTPVIALRSE